MVDVSVDPSNFEGKAWSSFAEKLDLDGTKNGMLKLWTSQIDLFRAPAAKHLLLLKATAGLRAKALAEAVLDTVRVFHESEYQFIGPWVEIIPGF